MGKKKYNDDDSRPANDVDKYSSTGGRPVSFDNLISRFAPLLISLDLNEQELIKMAYLSARNNNGVIDYNLLAEVLQVDERTLRNRRNKIIAKINSVLGMDGKTFPPPKKE